MKLSKTEVLVKVHATTVTTSDFIVRSFNLSLLFWLPARIALGFTKPRKPILGLELAGEIEAIGKDVQRLKKGDQVFAFTWMCFTPYPSKRVCPKTGLWH